MASAEQVVATEEASSRQSSTTAERPVPGGGGTSEAAGGEVDQAAAQAAVPAPPLAGEVDQRRRPDQADQVPATLAGAVRRNDLLWELQGFNASAAPARVAYFEGGAWRELLAPAVVQLLREGFLAGRSVVEVSLGGSPCMFDFRGMVLIDVATAEQKPIAWSNAHGRLFYPRIAGAGEGGAPLEEHWDETCPGEVEDKQSGWAGLQVLGEGEPTYALVEKLFSESMAASAVAARITSIRKCSNDGAAGRARRKVFQMWEQMTKAARGTANVRYSWYGGSAAGIAAVVAHGFGQPNHRAMRPAARAVGVYLAPAYSPLASVSMSVPDDGGERHVLLCRVILGKVEVVDTGRPRHHPGGADFDGGVDHPEKPSWYVVWPTHMNTHILPEFVVSFKTREPAAAVAGIIRRGLDQQRTPSRAQLAFEKMFAELGNLLPASRVHAMETLFDQLKGSMIFLDTDTYPWWSFCR